MLPKKFAKFLVCVASRDRRRHRRQQPRVGHVHRLQRRWRERLLLTSELDGLATQPALLCSGAKASVPTRSKPSAGASAGGGVYAAVPIDRLRLALSASQILLAPAQLGSDLRSAAPADASGTTRQWPYPGDRRYSKHIEGPWARALSRSGSPLWLPRSVARLGHGRRLASMRRRGRRGAGRGGGTDLSRMWPLQSAIARLSRPSSSSSCCVFFIRSWPAPPADSLDS